MTGLTVSPLRKKTANGRRLERPAAVEAEIAGALALRASELRDRAAIDSPEADGYLSSECLVHLIRTDIASAERRFVDDLAPILLSRCEGHLRGSVRGFDASISEEAREEILGRFVRLLVEPDDAADFFEVRFALALKRLRIDVCRQMRRRYDGLVALEEVAEPATGEPDSEAIHELRMRQPNQEQMAAIRQALAALGDAERKAFVLHRLMGVAVHSTKSGAPTVVEILGVSERTVRNLLTRAEAALSAD